jgi:hypoxanthine phosphoribosyltransferase
MVTLSFQTICERILQTDFPEVDLVVGIGSGGLLPASIVAFHLKKDLSVMTINYRDENNTPRHDLPKVLSLPEQLLMDGKKILLVDDVSVTGKTLQAAIELLNGHDITTFTLKGKADLVLFPEIGDCVKWPWKE